MPQLTESDQSIIIYDQILTICARIYLGGYDKTKLKKLLNQAITESDESSDQIILSSAISAIKEIENEH